MIARWSDRALRDLEEAHSFLNERNPPAARQFVQRILASVESVERFTLLGVHGRTLDTREYVVPHTRYIIVYRVGRESVQILRVLHSSRNYPGD